MRHPGVTATLGDNLMRFRRGRRSSFRRGRRSTSRRGGRRLRNPRGRIRIGYRM